MRAFRALMVVVFAAGSLAVAAPAVGAAVSAGSAFCNSVSSIGQSIDPESTSAESSRQYGNAFIKAARHSPNKKVKKAMKRLGRYYRKLARVFDDPDAYAETLGSYSAKYASAFSTYYDAYLGECLDLTP